tara:strand:- start:2614 stop:3180 length:567 start_codon:yes stop_codon:yes gene_type:complete
MPSIIQTDRIDNQAGSTTFLNNGTLSNLTFPTGHIIQTIADTSVPSSEVTIGSTFDDYLGANLQVTITPKATGNLLLISCFICETYNSAGTNYGLNAGFKYDASFSSGSTLIGPREAIAGHNTMLGTDKNLINNLYYCIQVVVGTNAPSAGSASIIRPFFSREAGDVGINANGASHGVNTLYVQEIQQ